MKNTMKNYKYATVLLLCGALLLCQSAFAATIYLVRHAEKNTGDNPALTEQGQQRANHLSQILKHADIKTVYSTDYKRTQQTAAPIAAMHGLDVMTYDARKLKDLTRRIIESNENAVIVGHSNTTPALTELLSQKAIEAMSEDQFGLIYQVVLPEKGQDTKPVVNVLSSSVN